MMNSWVIFLLISVSGNNFKFYWHAGGTDLLRKTLMWRIFDVDGGEALLLNWHADDGGLTDYPDLS